MTLTQWAARHGVSAEALAELTGIVIDPQSAPTGQSEAAVQQLVRLEASRLGMSLFRNNVGACKDDTGRVIRYGLCNDSAQMNKVIKSSDLIGIRPIIITPDMMGHTIGQFVAREVKRPGWSYRGTDREVAQQSFGQLVLRLGGDFKFCTGEGSL